MRIKFNVISWWSEKYLYTSFCKEICYYSWVAPFVSNFKGACKVSFAKAIKGCAVIQVAFLCRCRTILKLVNYPAVRCFTETTSINRQSATVVSCRQKRNLHHRLPKSKVDVWIWKAWFCLETLPRMNVDLLRPRKLLSRVIHSIIDCLKQYWVRLSCVSEVLSR